MKVNRVLGQSFRTETACNLTAQDGSHHAVSIANSQRRLYLLAALQRRFGAERVDVVAEEGWLESGTAIEVVRAEGYRNVVRAAGVPAE